MTQAEKKRRKELIDKALSAGYQKMQIDQFDELIAFINDVRKIVAVDGPVDALNAGVAEDSMNCPIALTLVAAQKSPVLIEPEVDHRYVRMRVTIKDPSQFPTLYPQVAKGVETEAGKPWKEALDEADESGNFVEYHVNAEPATRSHAVQVRYAHTFGDAAPELPVWISFYFGNPPGAVDSFVSSFDSWEIKFLNDLHLDELGVDELEELLA